MSKLNQTSKLFIFAKVFHLKHSDIKNILENIFMKMFLLD